MQRDGSGKEKEPIKIYFTITGTNYRYGQDFFKKGMKVRLEKEPDNKHDKEAIKVIPDFSSQSLRQTFDVYSKERANFNREEVR